MLTSPSFGIGDRLVRYRRLAGLSAQKLSDKTDGRISRGTIARIEAGVKTEVTLDEVLLLALALGVPPVALALPLETPYQYVGLWQGVSVSIGSLLSWFHGGPIELDMPLDEDGDTEDIYGTTATIVAAEIVDGLNKDDALSLLIHESVHPFLSEELGGNGDERTRDELLAERGKLRARLKMLGVTSVPRPESE